MTASKEGQSTSSTAAAKKNSGKELVPEYDRGIVDEAVPEACPPFRVHDVAREVLSGGAFGGKDVWTSMEGDRNLGHQQPEVRRLCPDPPEPPVVRAGAA